VSPSSLSPSPVAVDDPLGVPEQLGAAEDREREVVEVALRGAADPGQGLDVALVRSVAVVGQQPVELRGQPHEAVERGVEVAARRRRARWPRCRSPG
jgi:hypothetical protein